MKSLHRCALGALLVALGVVNAASVNAQTFSTGSSLLPMPAAQPHVWRGQSGYSNAGYPAAYTARSFYARQAEDIPAPAADEHNIAPADATPHSVVPQHGYGDPIIPHNHTGEIVGGGYAAPSAGCANCNGAGQGAATYQDGVAYEGDAWSDGYAGVDAGYLSGGNYNNFAAGACSWYGRVGGLVMTTDRRKNRMLSIDTATGLDNPIISTRDAAMDWSGGVEAFLGFRLDCNTAIEFGYWGLYPQLQEVNVLGSSMAGNLDAHIDYGALEYNDGGGNQFVNAWFDNSELHRLRREWQIHNAEINMVHSLFTAPACCGCNSCGLAGGCGGAGYNTYGTGYAGYGGWLAPWNGCGPRYSMNVIGGFRFFHFSEDFQFATDDVDTVFTGVENELYHDIEVDNNLFGFQIGCDGRYQITQCLSLRGLTKIGIFANRINAYQRVGGADGTAWYQNTETRFEINNATTDIAFIGEMDLGLDYQVTCNWALYGGYRAVAVSGVATTIGQIPSNFDDFNGAHYINSSESVILHGAYAGARFCY